jgi:hypothetical protein
MCRAVQASALAVVLTACAAERSRPPAPPVAEVAVPTAPAATSTEPAAPAPGEIDLVAVAEAATGCRLRGEAGDLVRGIDLRFRGRPFARLSGKVDVAEIALAGAPAAGHAVVRSSAGTFAGEVSGAAIGVRPRQSLVHEGWLRVRAGSVGAVGSDSQITLRVALPSMVHAKERNVAVAVACDEVSPTGPLASAPGATRSPVILAPGAKAPLRSVPRGAPFAELVVPTPPKGHGLRAAVSVATAMLEERRGNDVKIRLRGEEAWVEGWTDASVLDKTQSPLVSGLLASLTGTGLSDHTTWKCPGEVAVFVREGSDVARVGVIPAGAPVHLRETTNGVAPHPGEVKVELGLASSVVFGLLGQSGPPALEPFVRGAALGRCSPEPQAPPG